MSDIHVPKMNYLYLVLKTDTNAPKFTIAISLFHCTDIRCAKFRAQSFGMRNEKLQHIDAVEFE